MAEQDYEIYEDAEDYSGTDLVKKLRKQIDSLSKQVAERDNLIMEFQTYSHEAEVAAILEGYGLNPNIARYIPDEIEADPDAIAEWLTEYGADFGITAVDESEAGYEPDADAQTYEQMSNFDDYAYDPGVGLDITSRVEAATSQDELLSILRGQ
jgi:hypothetical protein